MSLNTLKILYNSGTIAQVYSQILDSARERWDFYTDVDSLTIPFKIEQIRTAISAAKKRDVRFRLITEITKGNIAFCKDVMKVAEVRHLEGIRGNFGVSDGEYISISSTMSLSDKALSKIEETAESAATTITTLQHAIYSNVKEDIQQHQYLFEVLWNKAIPAEKRVIEIEEGTERIETVVLEDSTEIAKRIRRQIESSNEIKMLLQAGGLQLIYNSFLESYRKVLDSNRKGKHKGIRCITTINKDNQELAKLFLNEGVQLRHTKSLIPLNFSISNKEFQATAQKLKGAKMVENLLISTEPIHINHYNSIFEQLWENSTDAKDRIIDIKEGVDLADIEVIRRPSRARLLYLELVKNAKQEILFIFPTSNAFIRQEKIGAVPLATKKEHNVNIRILVPYSELVEQRVQALVLERQANFTSDDLNFAVRYVEYTSDVKATVLVVDRNASLVMELRDDSKSTFDEAIGLSTYSNSRPGVLSYLSIFESLWNQAQLYEELKKHDKMQQEFINIAAHELRTPAQSILGYAELAKADSSYVEQQTQPFIDVVYRNALRIHKLTKDILDVTRIESQTLRLNKIRFNLVDVITSVLDDFRARLESENRNKVKLVYKTKRIREQHYHGGGDNDIFIVADKDRITQVISNLIDNALKFTSLGLIQISAERTKKSKRGREQQEEEFLVTVKDTGSGIDREIFPRLFTKFSSRSFTGTGLGLFICKNIIEAHGGRIWAKNNDKDETIKSGSTFYFSLPLPK